MSTKIYDAYRFDEYYNIRQIDEKMQMLRAMIKEQALQMIQRAICTEYAYYYGFNQFHSKEEIANLIKAAKEKENPRLASIWQYVLEEEWKLLYMEIYLYYTERVEDAEKHPTIRNHEFWYRSMLQIIPIKDKILLMYFGNEELQKIVERQPYIQEYHYQNQSDRLECISKEKWNIRKTDWEKAIGPDYIPKYHGFSVSLCPYADGFFNIPKPDFSTIKKKELIRELTVTFSDYPIQPKEEEVNEWIAYYSSSEYLEWLQEKKKFVQKKLRLPEEKEICNESTDDNYIF